MMGGGFGGCTLNLVKKSAVTELIKRVSASYKERFQISLRAYRVTISEGTTIL
jgi:galactokinase